MLVTKEKIPPKFDSSEVTLRNDKSATFAVINSIGVLSLGSKTPAWCGQAVTEFWVENFMYKVPDKTEIVNYDNAPGHNDVCIEARIKVSFLLVQDGLISFK